MNVDGLIKMANEIAAFFDAETDRELAAANMANHLRRYWEPRMRRQIIEHYRHNGAGLVDLARSGVALLAGETP